MAHAIPEVKSLTGLRGVAAMWVIGYHCHLMLLGAPMPSLPFAWGFLGVDVFFVLSGYMLASIYPKLSYESFRPFFIKRVLRIYPLHLFIMLLLGFLVGCATLMGHALGAHYTLASFLAVASLTHVPLCIYGWNDPTWSISVEMICYIFLPFFLFITRKLSKWGCILIALATLALDVSLLTTAIYIADESRLPMLVGWVAVSRGGLGFFLGCIIAKHIPIGTMINKSTSSFFSSKPIYYLGEISFSLYLVHQPIISLVRKLEPLIARHHLAYSEPALIFLATICVSHFTYKYIENPGRNIFWTHRSVALMFRRARHDLNATGA